jgi:putative ABC transport system substrate-binding protein
MRRREFIAFLGGVATTSMFLPFAARAQQPPVPVIGYLDTASASAMAHFMDEFRRGLKDGGLHRGQERRDS